MSGESKIPEVHCLPHMPTWTCTYVVADAETKRAAVVDAVMDYNPDEAKVSFEHADTVIAFVKEKGYTVDYILETHAHADHLTGAQYLKDKLGGKLAMGANIGQVQKTFAPVFDVEDPGTGLWDQLFNDGDEFKVGNLTWKVMHTPGHTPACVCYLVGDAIFTGDTLFHPDMGTARCDFPGGSADLMYASVMRIYELPDDTRQFLGHDYPGDRRPFTWEVRLGDQKTQNKQLKATTSRDEYVTARTARDAQLSAPKLLLPSLQVNIRAGRLPPAAPNGTSYMKLPIKQVQK